MKSPEVTAIDPLQRARICSFDRACLIACQMTEEDGNTAVVVLTGEPIQPYKVYYAHECPPGAFIQAEYRAA